MPNTKVLNKNELEKVVGGVSDADISEAVSILQQISNEISNSTLEDYYKSGIFYYINLVIEYLNHRDFYSAKIEYGSLMENINNSAARWPGAFSDDFTDTINGLGLIMNNIN